MKLRTLHPSHLLRIAHTLQYATFTPIYTHVHTCTILPPYHPYHSCHLYKSYHPYHSTHRRTNTCNHNHTHVQTCTHMRLRTLHASHSLRIVHALQCATFTRICEFVRTCTQIYTHDNTHITFITIITRNAFITFTLYWLCPVRVAFAIGVPSHLGYRRGTLDDEMPPWQSMQCFERSHVPLHAPSP